MLRRESLFTQDKESGARLLITFYQFYSECGNFTFDVCAVRQVTCEKVTRKWKTAMKKHGKIAHKRSKLIFNVFF